MTLDKRPYVPCVECGRLVPLADAVALAPPSLPDAMSQARLASEVASVAYRRRHEV
jgi:hypothetical protein